MNTFTQVRTRIAPSPTGKMHVGTARTALFNYLFAKHHKGQYVVRIEDTDKERSTPENIAFIKEALAWLALTPDEEYVLQTNNIKAHIAAAETLLAEGKAYKDNGAVRFKIPAGATSWHDMVQGDINYDNEQLEDFVILRSDNTPTYHLGVVVDDIAMRISHVIRGDDHINNTPKQILLYQALGAEIPTFGHVPLIHGEDGKKLSKRNGALSVQELRDMGLLAEAVNNYLLKLGWAHGDEEFFTRAQAIALFNGTGLTQGAAIFDMKKLRWYNAHYIRTMADETAANYIMNHYNVADDNTIRPRLLSGMEELKKRAETLPELAEAADFYISTPTVAISDEQRAILVKLSHELNLLNNWNIECLVNILKTFITQENIKFKAIGIPLRLALMGRTNGPSLTGSMVALGKDETLSRLTTACA